MATDPWSVKVSGELGKPGKLHLLWQARADVGEALVYLLLVIALLGWRLLAAQGSLRRAG